jgi:ribosome recycling factor
MPVDLVTLLKVAPFPEKERQIIFANLDKLTEEHKEKLTKTAWLALTEFYKARLEYEYGILNQEILQGKIKHNKEDFIKAKNKILSELIKKLKLEETKESVEKVRAELHKHVKEPVKKQLGADNQKQSTNKKEPEEALE